MFYKVFIITFVVVLAESYPDYYENAYYHPGKKFVHKNKQVHLFLRQPFLKQKDHHYHHHHFHDDEIGEHKYYVENYKHERPNPPKYKNKKLSSIYGADYHHYNPHGAYKFHEQFYNHHKSPYNTKQFNVNYQVFHNIHDRPNHHDGHHGHRNHHNRLNRLNRHNHQNRHIRQKRNNRQKRFRRHNSNKRHKRHQNFNQNGYNYKFGPPPYYQHDFFDSHPEYFAM